jgi:indolepyruvate ferredoxin oxidoreductase beta subunit
MGIIYRSVPAEEIAMNLGAPMSSNLALLGFFSAFREGPITHEELRNTIDRVSPDRFKEMNFKVFDAGFKEGTKERS